MHYVNVYAAQVAKGDVVLVNGRYPFEVARTPERDGVWLRFHLVGDDEPLFLHPRWEIAVSKFAPRPGAPDVTLLGHPGESAGGGPLPPRAQALYLSMLETGGNVVSSEIQEVFAAALIRHRELDGLSAAFLKASLFCAAMEPDEHATRARWALAAVTTS